MDAIYYLGLCGKGFSKGDQGLTGKEDKGGGGGFEGPGRGKLEGGRVARCSMVSGEEG